MDYNTDESQAKKEAPQIKGILQVLTAPAVAIAR